jgi:hypothetical protein
MNTINSRRSGLNSIMPCITPPLPPHTERSHAVSQPCIRAVARSRRKEIEGSTRCAGARTRLRGALRACSSRNRRLDVKALRPGRERTDPAVLDRIPEFDLHGLWVGGGRDRGALGFLSRRGASPGPRRIFGRRAFGYEANAWKAERLRIKAVASGAGRVAAIDARVERPPFHARRRAKEVFTRVAVLSGNVFATAGC